MDNSILKIKHLKKSFGNNVIFHDLNLSVKKGEVVVIVGPSGCGKSTLLRCVNGLEEVQEGSVELLGVNVLRDGTEIRKLRQKIGMVFQSYELFPHMSVLENIMLAPVKVQKRNKKEVREEAISLLQRVGLVEKANSLPRELSGGQKQRIAIVRALCMHPELLLFDEVTAALDPEMVREVLEVIIDLADQGKTMLIVTHEMAFAKAVADRIIFIDEGRIIDDDVPESFFEEPKSERAKKFLQTFTYERKERKVL